MYRILVEQLFGLKGVPEGLRIDPMLPSAWSSAFAARRFRGAHFDVSYRRETAARTTRVQVDGKPCDGLVIGDLQAGRSYRVDVVVP
jgi:cellobionic acid phosphorylase